MKTLHHIGLAAACALLAATAIAPAPAHAQDARNGFYAGAAVNAQWLNGGGVWDAYEFDIDQPLDTEASSLGFNWQDHLLLGLQPLLGYRVSGGFALQAGYTVNIAKSSSQSITETTGTYYYEQGMTFDWAQRTWEVLALWRPHEDSLYYLQGGAELVTVDMDVSWWEGSSSMDNIGNPIASGSFDKANDKLSALGFVIGAGLEWVSETGGRTVFASAKYSSATTDDTFFQTPGFKVDVGGISLTGGIRFSLGKGDAAGEDQN